MTKKTMVLGGLLAAGLVWGLLRWTAERGMPDARDDATADPGAAIFYDRLWVDSFPENPRDDLELFVAITENPIGIFDKSSTWRGTWELFRHGAQGDGVIELLYPQTGKKERAKYHAWRCTEGGFDFCLDLKGSSHGVTHYHSLEGWEIGALATADAIRARAAELLATHLPAADVP